MPVEPERASKRLEEEGIAYSPQKLSSAVFMDDQLGYCPTQTFHSFEQPRWASSLVQGKLGDADPSHGLEK